MKAMISHERAALRAHLSVRVALLIWRHLALLLLIDLLLCLTALPTVLLFLAGLSLLVPTAAALTLGPVWMAAAALANAMLRDEEVGWRVLPRALRRYWRRGLAVSAVPAAVATLLIGTLDILQMNPQAHWLYFSLFANGSLATLTLLACLPVFALASSTDLHGWSLWKVSLILVARRPLAMLGALVLLALLALLVNWLGTGLLPMLAAPLALYLAAVTRETLIRIQRDYAATPEAK